MTEDFGVEVNSETIQVWTHTLYPRLPNMTNLIKLESYVEFCWQRFLLDYQQASCMESAYPTSQTYLKRYRTMQTYLCSLIFHFKLKTEISYP